MGCSASSQDDRSPISRRLHNDIFSDVNPSKTLNSSLKFCLSGSSTVGKSRFFSTFFDVPYAANTGVGGENEAKNIYLKKTNTTYSLFLWDTAGQEKHKTITRNFYLDAIGIFLLFDIKNKASFEAIKTVWYPNIIETIDVTKVKVLLIANKIDLHDPTDEGELKILKDAKAFAESNDLLFSTCNSFKKEIIMDQVRILLEGITDAGLVD